MQDSITRISNGNTSVMIALNTLVEKYGNPRIVTSKLKVGGKPTATFNPFTNTIRGESIDDVIAELAHAYQLQRDGLRGFIKHFIVSYFRSPFINRTQQLKQYNLKGGIEYEAHEVIEPKLQKEFIELLNK